jgi:fluoride exporter
MLLFLIALGGATGALARYAATGWIQARAGAGFPLGTLVVNVAGSLLIAFLVRFLEGIAAPPEWRGLLAIGFCGAFTTFSTFGYESVQLLEGGQWNRLVVYVMSSVLLSLLAVLFGFRLAQIALTARG